MITQLFFRSKTFFCILIKFQMAKTIQNSIYLAFHVSNFPKSLSINLTHQGLFNNTKIGPKVPCNFLFWFKWIQWIFCSIFNNFSTIGWNVLKPIWCTPIHWGPSNNIESVTRSTMVWEISMHYYKNRFFWARKFNIKIP